MDRVRRFQLGTVVATPGAIETLRDSGESAAVFLARHLAGDWGSVDDEDRQANEAAIRSGGRIMSVYSTSLGVELWVITEADRSSTCVLLPEEY